MPSSRTVRKLCDVRDLMRDCYQESLTLQSLSLEAELSAWHFLRAFRDAFGETPHEFLTKLRIDHAKRLLARDQLPVTEVCFAVGYESLGSFSTLFRTMVGYSPAAYQRAIRRIFPVPKIAVYRFIPSCYLVKHGIAPF